MYIKQDVSDFWGRERNIKKANKRENNEKTILDQMKGMEMLQKTHEQKIHRGVKGEEILKTRTTFCFEEIARFSVFC